MINAFLHSDQAKATDVLRIEALAVILNGEQDMLSVLAHANPHGLRFRVACAVVQRLLHHAIAAGVVVIRKVVGDSICLYAYPYASTLGDFSRVPLKCRHQAE